MGKRKVKAILTDLESLTSQERIFLTKKLIKWTASDMRMHANAVDRLTNELNNARECADILRMEIADFNAKRRGVC